MLDERRATRRSLIDRGAAIVTAGAAGAAGVAACGEGASIAAIPTASAAPYKVAFGWTDGGERMQMAQMAVAEFSRVNGPKYTAEQVAVGGDALIAAMAARTAPDVIQTSGSRFSDLADKEQWQDLTPFVKRDKIDLNRWYLQEEVFIRKGKQYGFPFWQAHAVYLYNKTMFAKAGIRPPDNETWTWNDMLDAAQRLTRTGETFGIQMGVGFEFSWLNFLRSAGEDYINKERTKTPLNTIGAVEVMQWLVDLSVRYKAHPLASDTTSLGAGDWWLLGKIGIRLSGTGILGRTLTARPDFDWDMFITPKHPKTGKRVITANENPMAVTSSTKNSEAAYMFAYFMGDRYVQDLVGKFRINTPSLKQSAAEINGWLSTPPASMSLSLEQMKQAGTLSFHLNWAAWYAEIIAQLKPAFDNTLSVKEACDNASRIGDTLLRGV
jgi:multiple sugar transport system substrate-binding protein